MQVAMRRCPRSISARTYSSGVEAVGADMQGPLFNRPDVTSSEDAAIYGSSIRDQTNFYVKEVSLVAFCHIKVACTLMTLLYCMQRVLIDPRASQI